MRLFAVRVIKDKQPVGFFWALDFTTLWWMIDSVCDPGDCECLRIKERAALTWPSRVNAKLGVKMEFDDTMEESPTMAELRKGISFEFAFEDLVFSEIKDGWEKVPFADEPGGEIHDLFQDEER